MPEFVTDAEFIAKTRDYAKGPRGPRERTDDQKPWDEAFENAYTNSRPLFAQVRPDEAEEAHKRVAAAARFYKLATTEGEARPGKAKGTVVLSWKIRKPSKRAPKSSE